MLAEAAERRGAVAPEPRRARDEVEDARRLEEPVVPLDEEWYAAPTLLASPERPGAAHRRCGARFTVDEDGEVEMRPELELWYPQGPHGPSQTGGRDTPTSCGV